MTTLFTYSIESDFPNSKLNENSLISEIQASSITIALSSVSRDGDTCYIDFKTDLSTDEETVLAGLVAAHLGETIIEEDYGKTVDKKLWVHETSRPAGTYTLYTSRFDNPAIPSDVGGGNYMTVAIQEGDHDANHIKYFDINGMHNDTFLHEPFIQKYNCQNDIIIGEVVTKTTEVLTPGIHDYDFTGEGLNDCTSSGTFTGSVKTKFIVKIDSVSSPNTFIYSTDDGETWSSSIDITGSAQTLEDGVEVTFLSTTAHTIDDQWTIYAIPSTTDYKLYNNYLIVPSIFPVGTVVDIIENPLDPYKGGLVYFPLDEDGNQPTSYWSASYNTTTHMFENLAAAPLGDGKFNMFAVEIVLFRFVDIALLGSDTMWLQSADRQKLGHGMRFKITPHSSDYDSDIGAGHDWKASMFGTIYREKTI